MAPPHHTPLSSEARARLLDNSLDDITRLNLLHQPSTAVLRPSPAFLTGPDLRETSKRDVRPSGTIDRSIDGHAKSRSLDQSLDEILQAEKRRKLMESGPRVPILRQQIENQQQQRQQQQQQQQQRQKQQQKEQQLQQRLEELRRHRYQQQQSEPKQQRLEQQQQQHERRQRLEQEHHRGRSSDCSRGRHRSAEDSTHHTARTRRHTKGSHCRRRRCTESSCASSDSRPGSGTQYRAPGSQVAAHRPVGASLSPLRRVNTNIPAATDSIQAFVKSLPRDRLLLQEADLLGGLCNLIKRSEVLPLLLSDVEAIPEVKKLSQELLPSRVTLFNWIGLRVSQQVEVFTKNDGLMWLGPGPCFDPSDGVDFRLVRLRPTGVSLDLDELIRNGRTSDDGNLQKERVERTEERYNRAETRVGYGEKIKMENPRKSTCGDETSLRIRGSAAKAREDSRSENNTRWEEASDLRAQPRRAKKSYSAMESQFQRYVNERDSLSDIGANFFSKLPPHDLTEDEQKLVAHLCAIVSIVGVCSVRRAETLLAAHGLNGDGLVLPSDIPLSLWVHVRLAARGDVELFRKGGEEWIGAGPCFDPSVAQSSYFSLVLQGCDGEEVANASLTESEDDAD